jgi:hypothetical protein
MVQSCDELIMEIAAETGLDRMGEDDSDDEDEDDDRGDAVAPPAATPSPTAAPPAATPEMVIGEEEEEDLEELVLEQEPPEESEPQQPHLFTVLMRDREESPSRMYDDLDDLDDPTHADYDVDEWFPKDGSRDRD